MPGVGGALESLERKCALLMGPPRLGQNFPEAPNPGKQGTIVTSLTLAKRYSGMAPQATPVALCDISTLSPRLESRWQHLLHSDSFCPVGFSSCSSRESVSEITTSFSSFLFSSCYDVFDTSVIWGRNGDVHGGAKSGTYTCKYLAMSCPLTRHVSGFMKDPDAVLTRNLASSSLLPFPQLGHIGLAFCDTLIFFFPSRL